MTCAHCSHENRPGVRFCTRCGNPLLPVCPNCGFETVAGDLFCGNCGADLSLQASPSAHGQIPLSFADTGNTQTASLESERKHVTVLFADISGFTEISQQLDPEEVTELMNGCLKQLADTVIKYEGYVDKFIGDCIMAIFGAPVTHENDPELAVRAALEMQQVIAAYNESVPMKLEKPLRLHIGINSGMVVAGGIGSDRKMEYTVMGDTVNLASRLESIAVGGQIFVSKYTHNLVRNAFDFIVHEPIKVKGKKDPIPVYQVVGIKSAQEEKSAVRRAKTPLIGRSREMATLKDRVERLLAGESQVIFLKSDAGIGKSRLQMEIDSYLVDKPVQVIYGSCHSFSRSTGYFLFAEILKGLFSIESEDLPEAMAEKLAFNLPVLTGMDPEAPADEAREAIVFLGSLLGLNLGADYDIPVRHMDAQDVKVSIFRSIRWLFERLAERNPLVLVLEDLHYADDSTVEVINYLFETIRDRAIMLLLLLRPEARHSSSSLTVTAHQSLGANCTEILVDRLSPEESDELVRSLLGTADVPDAILNMIRSRADGNPFYIEAMARDLVENGIIEVEAGQPVRILKEIDRVAIPDTIQGMIVSRIDRLPGALKDILQTAAVIGPVFKHETLERVAEHNGLDGHLQRLVEMDMLFESKSYPEIEYSFKNILTQEAAYSCLLRTKRRDLHRVVARAIEVLYHDRLEDHYEVLAMHYQNAQHFSKAYDYSVRSGMKARRIYANQNAIDHFQQAIELGRRVEDPGIPGADLYVSLSEVYELTGDLDLAIDAREKAIALMDDDLEKADSQRNIGRILEKKGSKEAALEVYHRVFELLKERPESIEMARLLMNESWVLNRMQQPDAAIEKCSRALGLFEALGATDDIAQAHNNLAVFFESKGDLDLALEHNRKSLALFQELKNKRKLGNIYLSLGYVYDKRGELDTALEYFDRSVTTMEQIGNRYGVGTALMAKGRCYLDMQRLDEAESVLSRSLRIHRDLHLGLKIVANLIGLARVALEKGNLDPARACLAEAREIAAAEDNRSDLAKISRLEADLLIRERKDPGKKFEEAVAAFRALDRERDAEEATRALAAFRAHKKGITEGHG